MWDSTSIQFCIHVIIGNPLANGRPGGSRLAGSGDAPDDSLEFSLEFNVIEWDSLFETWKMLAFRFSNQSQQFWMCKKKCYRDWGRQTNAMSVDVPWSYYGYFLASKLWPSKRSSTPLGNVELGKWLNIGQVNSWGNVCNMFLNRILFQGHAYCSMLVDPPNWKVWFEVLETKKHENWMQEHLQILMISYRTWFCPKQGTPKSTVVGPFPCYIYIYLSLSIPTPLLYIHYIQPADADTGEAVGAWCNRIIGCQEKKYDSGYTMIYEYMEK